MTGASRNDIFSPTSFMIEGYAAVFGAVDQSGDVVRRGAFDLLWENDRELIPATPAQVMMLYQHAADRPIGRWHLLQEDQHGLFVRGEIFADTALGKDLYSLLRGRALNGLSIGFKPVRSRRNAKGQRELIDIDLWEISIVTFPMAQNARITRVGDLGTPLPRNLLSA